MCNLYSMTTNQGAFVPDRRRPDRQSLADAGRLSRLHRAQSCAMVAQRVSWPWHGGACRHRPGFSKAESPTRASPMCATRLRRTGAGGLGVESRCLVPFTSLAEPDHGTFKGRAPVWFALDESRPLACFAGIGARWTSVRKVREGEMTNDIFAFVTTEPNAETGILLARADFLALATNRVRTATFTALNTGSEPRSWRNKHQPQPAFRAGPSRSYRPLWPPLTPCRSSRERRCPKPPFR